MKADFCFVSVALISGMLLAGNAHAQVDNSQPSQVVARPKSSQAPRGEIAVDVTVRTHPRLAAPGIKDLPAGTLVRSGPSKALGWTRIVEPVSGWIPSETYAVRGEDAENATSVGSAAPAEPEAAALSRREHRSPAPRLRRSRGAPGDRSGAGDDAAPGLRPPASGLVASTPAEGRAPGSERSESELMLEALTASRGESPNAARIARVVAETTKEVRRKRINEPLATFWKDPFVDDSEPPALVIWRRGRRGGTRAMAGAAEDRPGTLPVEASREAARARAETAVSRAETAATRAEAARAKAELARREAAAAQADALAAKREAAEALSALNDRPERRHRSLERGVAWRELSLHDGNRAERVRKPPRREGPSVIVKRASRSAGGVATTTGDEMPADDLMAPHAPTVFVPAPPPEAPVPSVPPPDVPPQSSSAGYHGILVVPLK
ncbi:MAG: hypothetical protein ABJA82_13350 [Myxococcales bacterium]